MLDLEWLHRVGVRGVQLFYGGMGTPQVVPELVQHGSAQWRDAVRLATETAQRLGPGVRRRHLRGLERGRRAVGRAGRRDEEGGLVRDARRRRRAGRAAAGRRCPTSPGPTRTARAGAPTPTRTGSPGTGWSSPSPRTRCQPPGAVLRHGLGAAGGLVGAARRRLRRRRRRCRATPTAGRPPGSSRSSTRRSPSPRSPSACPGPRGFGAAPPPTAVLEASDDGGTYRVVAELTAPEDPPPRRCRCARSPSPRSPPAGSGSCSPARPPSGAAPARRGRAAAAVLRRVSEFLVSEFALFPGGRVHQAELKAGFAAAPTTTPWTPTRRRRRRSTRHRGRPDRAGGRRRRAALGRAARHAGGSCGWACRSPARPTARRRPRRPAWRSTSSTAAPSAATWTPTWRCSTAPTSMRCSATASSPGPQNATDGCASGSPSCAATTRCRGCRRWRAWSSATRRAPTGSCTTTGAPSPSWSPASTTARSRPRRTPAA